MKRIVAVSAMLIFCSMCALVLILPTISATTAEWKDDVRLTNDPNDSFRPDIAVDSQNNAHVVWVDAIDDGCLCYKKSDGGAWSSDVDLGEFIPEARNNEGGAYPSVAVDDNDNIHVAFVAQRKLDFQFEIFYTAHSGGSWSTPQRITINSGYSIAWSYQMGPKIATDHRGYVYIFWTGYKNYIDDNRNVFYTFHNGNDWSSIQQMTADEDGTNYRNPQIAVDSNNYVHVVYNNLVYGPGGFVDYMKVYKETSTLEKRISEGNGAGPTIAIDAQNNLHLAWTDFRDAEWSEAYYSKLDNNGNTLVNDLRLTNSAEHLDTGQSISVDSNGDLHVVWMHGIEDDKSSLTIYYTKLNSTGSTLIENVSISPTHHKDDVVSESPHIAIDSQNRLHVIFGDDRDGNTEIYYKSTYLQDLFISSTDIQFSNTAPGIDEPFYINATVHNIGEVATNGTVKIYHDSVSEPNLLLSENATIAASGSYTASVLWSGGLGDHTFYVVVETNESVTESSLENNEANALLTVVNQPPSITVTNPPTIGSSADTTYLITWIDSDADDNALVSLYYDSDASDLDGTLIVSDIEENDETDAYLWDISPLPDDSAWYIYAMIDDGVNSPNYDYSDGALTVDHPNTMPTVAITSPTGGTVSDTVTITGTASDTDGSIALVQVRISDGDWLETQGTTSWTYEWDTTQHLNAIYTIEARSYDYEDYSDLASVEVTVENFDTTPPVITTGPEITSKSDVTVTIAWFTDEDSSGIVEYGLTTSYGSTVTDSKFTMGHSVTLTGLSPSTTYHYRVSSSDSEGNGPTVSTDRTFTTNSEPDIISPVITTGPTVSDISDNRATVSWATDEPSSTVVEYGTTTSYGISKSQDGFVTQHSLTLTGLLPDTTYHFYVSSSDAEGNGPTISEDFNFITNPAPALPAITSGPSASAISENRAIITWTTDRDCNGIVDYGTTASYGSSKSHLGFLTQHSVTLSELLPDTQYHFRISSTDEEGVGPTVSGDMTFTTNPPPDTTPPTFTEGPYVSSLSGDSAVITWSTDEDSNGIVDYGTTTSYGLTASDSGFSARHSITITGLLPSTVYHYQVSASDAEGNGPTLSQDLTFTTESGPDITPPVITSGPTATSIADTSAVVFWFTNEPSSRQIEYGITTSYGSSISEPEYDTFHSILLSNLLPGTIYHYRARSADSSGNIATSADLTFQTQADPDTESPQITTLSPPTNSLANGITTVAVNASDNIGVVKVEFYLDGILYSQGNVMPCSWYWNADQVQDRTYTVSVKVYDGSGNEDENSIELIVDNQDLPVVVMERPGNVVAKGNVTLTGTAYDPDLGDEVVLVELRIDEGKWIPVDGTVAWSQVWDTATVDDGLHTLWARAFDGTDYSFATSIVLYVTNTNVLPTVYLTSSFPTPVLGSIAISGSASDTDEGIHWVEIKVDDGDWDQISVVSQDGTWVYDLDTSTLSQGRHTITVRAYDGRDYSEVDVLTLEVAAPIDENEWPIPMEWILLSAILVVVIAGFGIHRARITHYSARPPTLLEPVMVHASAIAPEPVVALQEVECPRCGTVFNVVPSMTSIKCPGCGVGGKVGDV